MSLQISVSVSDTVTPDLRNRIARLAHPTALLNSIGNAVAYLAKRAFSEPGLRPAAWPPKKDGSTATLRKTSVLSKSPRVTAVTSTSVTVGSDRPYAAIHQLGKPFPWRRGQKKGKAFPARPFFPFTPEGRLTERADQEIRHVIAAYLFRD